jgi:SNW domain-containing protein 1
MEALLRRLPQPVHEPPAAPAAAPAPAAGSALARAGGPPAPGYGARRGFIPRRPSDFGDGGAYPECHVAQYPLECGRKAASGGAGGAKTGVVAVSVTEDGSVDYSAIMKQGSNANKVVHTAHSALVPKLHDMTAEVRFSLAAVARALLAGTDAAAPRSRRRTWRGRSRRWWTRRWRPPRRSSRRA